MRASPVLARRIRNRGLGLALLTLVALFCVLPSLTASLPNWLRVIIPTRGMRLGLDLQGGMHLVLKVDTASAVQHHLDTTLSDLRDKLQDQGLATEPPEPAGADRVRLRPSRPGTATAIKQWVKDEFRNLDLADNGNGFLDLTLKTQDIQTVADSAVAQSLEILRNRIDQFGVTEPVMVRQGRDEIVLQLPGVADPERALELIGRTAQLEFKLVATAPGLNLPALIHDAIQDGRLKPTYSHQELNRALAAALPAGVEVDLEKQADPDSNTIRTVPILLQRTTLMTGEMLQTAHMMVDRRFNQPYVSLTFNARGARVFDRVTHEHVGQRLAIVLDHVVQSAPVVQQRISGGKAQITGTFTAQEANDLAIVLRAGALPAPVHIVQNLTVGPSLGRDSIQNGMASAVLGTLLVVTFMVVYYRLSGAIANLALLLNLILMLAALSLCQATLTLPGIAGIVLSVGMAVDSNVLIFERMREELALHKTVYAGVRAGYDRALSTIIDAHVTTLITALALFLFGTGPIKGFAVTLSLGVLFNLFTALYGTRVVYDYLHVKRRLTAIRFLHLVRKPRIDFIRWRQASFLVSSAFIALGLVAFVQIGRGKANLGVDFSGGTMVQFRADRPFQLDEVRTALSRHHLADYELQDVPRERVLIVRAKQSGPAVGSVAEGVAAVLRQELPQHAFTVESQAEIGASVSRDLNRAALLAIAISLSGIIVYLAWRFDRRFSVAAALATFHDVLAVLGVFYLLDREITLLVVTALLTLAGYSLTDTVVVFDRIRENLRRKGRQPLKDVINQSINDVLGRTLITSGTVLMVLAALLLMGGPLLRDFALALFLGVIVGTYSSVFVASPIVYVWPDSGNRQRERVELQQG